MDPSLSDSGPGPELAPTPPVASGGDRPRPLVRLRRAQLALVVGFAGLFPARWLAPKVGVPPGMAELLVLVVALFGMLRAYTFLCPRCGWLFVVSWRWQNVFASACVHCGYPRPGQPNGQTRQPRSG